MSHRKHQHQNHHQQLQCCRVCGAFYDDFYPWGEDGKTASFAICQCCGVEFGNDDETPEEVEKSRTKWLKSGADWLKEKARPKDWNLEKQLENIVSKPDAKELLEKFKIS